MSRRPWIPYGEFCQRRQGWHAPNPGPAPHLTADENAARRAAIDAALDAVQAKRPDHSSHPAHPNIGA